MKKYIAETIGTFALVFAGTGAIVINDVQEGAITHVGIALTFGLVVMAMIYAIGDISGAHINPAVTLGFWLARRFDKASVVPYLVCQLVGALLASTFLRLMFDGEDFGNLGATLPAGSWIRTFFLEVILTFLLMFVILRVSTGAKEKGIMAGAAIGAVVAFEAMFAGPISGASMNPARSIGPAVVGGNLNHLWVYVAAPTTGAALAVLICRSVQEDGCCFASDSDNPED